VVVVMVVVVVVVMLDVGEGREGRMEVDRPGAQGGNVTLVYGRDTT